ncbi:hypothetical protein BDV96DRAFT_592977 [Lophiotrema nucula]|uniref:Uncharacterized protein n=1 Tax=Lophiotrema nucula TaxID=690887 RepID=A0A6A5ZRZ3_9PLEO|nr:hypothetical protein BDV96DRAFT_592977 [Lophiotrema nucula]
MALSRSRTDDWKRDMDFRAEMGASGVIVGSRKSRLSCFRSKMGYKDGQDAKTTRRSEVWCSTLRFKSQGVWSTQPMESRSTSVLIMLAMCYYARIVVTGSGVHDPKLGWGIKVDYSTASEAAHPPPTAVSNCSGRDRYASSKLVNVLWTYALARRFAQSGSRKTVNVLPRMVPVLRVLMRTSDVHAPQESGESLAWHALGEPGGESESDIEGGRCDHVVVVWWLSERPELRVALIEATADLFRATVIYQF